MPNRPQMGRAIAPKEDSIEVVSVRMPAALKARIQHIAVQEERSTSWMTRRLLEQGVGAWERGERKSG